MNLTERIAAGDTSLYDHVESQTSEGDRVSFLALHDTVARELGQFSYLEIGSHLGGTLQVFVADPRCSAIVSVDPRPPSQPDDRGPVFHYDGNSTERMLGLLGAVPGAELGKLQTIERSSEDIGPWEVGRPDLAFIDGEHTHSAALRDARFCREVMGTAGVIAFHDSGIIGPAIHEFVAETRPAAAFPVRDGLYLVELGTVAHILACPPVADRAYPTAPE
ncbi:class I SAM-dependent methyltransferase [Pseudonocardia broussonetiae]|uniref:Class I SAM-dependent methyltransferase n=1 Tax=Pseudonocardia broussonetiae TaxID=2736640 RepID=A0A6M6JLZ1_9PSEU|nr:class I SAM-dependent methyltransferase [Pseudonocardia broussonetiae]QJY47947.1 class I SAM-dependent methyltransferase [Pseudonocardia broussonetiae]